MKRKVNAYHTHIMAGEWRYKQAYEHGGGRHSGKANGIVSLQSSSVVHPKRRVQVANVLFEKGYNLYQTNSGAVVVTVQMELLRSQEPEVRI